MATKTELEQAKFEAWVASDKSITPAELAIWMRKDSQGRYFSITAKAGWAAWQASRIFTLEEAIAACKTVSTPMFGPMEEDYNVAAQDCEKKIKELL
jgi:hypothetical protein